MAEKVDDISVGHRVEPGTNHVDMFNVRLTISESISQNGFEASEVMSTSICFQLGAA
jgi:hypothetical protein